MPALALDLAGEAVLGVCARALFNWEFKDHADFYRKYGAHVDPVEHSKMDFMLSYYQGIGLLVRRNLIDPELVYQLMRYGIIAFWDKVKPVVEGDRARLKVPNMFENVEYLYDLLKSFREKEKPATAAQP
ncbi:MAG: hypothetical protein V1924_07900 [Candidatus Bathyarchaeota archaeon]